MNFLPYLMDSSEKQTIATVDGDGIPKVDLKAVDCRVLPGFKNLQVTAADYAGLFQPGGYH
jgi:hypothetical protein